MPLLKSKAQEPTSKRLSTVVPDDLKFCRVGSGIGESQVEVIDWLGGRGDRGCL